MLGELITLPLRVGVRVTRLWLRGAEQAFSVGRQVLAGTGVVPGGSTGVAPGGRRAPDSGRDSERLEREPSWDDAPASRRSPAPEPPLRPAPQPRSGSEPEPETPEPAHVSSGAVLVAEVAEPGAEEGAGPEIHVEEPWSGYGRMSARDILNRLATASPEKLAAIQLYERAHRARQTVLNETERRLRSASGVGSQT